MTVGLLKDTPVLAAIGVVKQFPGVRALDGVSLDVRPGEVHALVGENGAGKSTLMHVLAGALQPDAGEIRLDGVPVRFADPRAALERRIAVVYQELSLADDLPICENIFANRQPVGRFGLIDRAEMRRRTLQLLADFDWCADPEMPVRALGAADRQVVEVLKAISSDPRVVILDEPTSSLTAREKERLFALIRRRRAAGVAFIYISHHLPEVFDLADRVTVLRDGRHVRTAAAASLTEDDLVRAMVGRELQDVYGSRSGVVGDTRLEVRGATRAGVYEDVSLSVRAGEIVGLAGLAGAGRTELARGVFGAEPMDRGTVQIDGRRVEAGTPSAGVAAGVAYITESRKEDGLFLEMSISANCAAVRLREFANRFGLMDDARLSRNGEEMRRRYGIAAPSSDVSVGALSGGNQQKVLFAMWTGKPPAVLIADEPTRGVDVAARCEIYEVLRSLAACGSAILLISSDLPELLGMCDRILVMRQGRLVGEFASSEATEEKVVACAAGVAAERAGE